MRTGLGWLAARQALEWVESMEGWEGDGLGSYRCIILAKGNVVSEHNHTPWATPEAAGRLAAWVERGGALLALHAGFAGQASVPSLQPVLGARFTGHPDPCMVRLAASGEPVLFFGQGKDVELFDEHYRVQFADRDSRVFLSSRSVHGVQPAGWVRSVGLGRVCVLTPGHFPAVLADRRMQGLVSNALDWLHGC
jgi:type 1 glutamine amidotransferase